ncbi:Uncharacterised protein [Mycobacteroides abscessus subsp. abscessus]|nr:Uncharacterised protein [Mycobacteroides abscessus subsp. abscessus]
MAAVDPRAETGDDGRRFRGTGQTRHLVAAGEQFGDDGAADESGCSGDENVHGDLFRRRRTQVMSDADITDGSTDVRSCHQGIASG